MLLFRNLETNRKCSINNADQLATIPPLAWRIAPGSDPTLVPLPAPGLEIRSHPHLIGPAPPRRLDAEGTFEDFAH